MSVVPRVHTFVVLSLYYVFLVVYYDSTLMFMYMFTFYKTHTCFVYRERLVSEYDRTGELLVDLASDQTSLHNPFGGGYYPVQLSYNEAQKVMSSEPMRFKELVQER